jgi:hypothetical protein
MSSPLLHEVELYLTKPQLTKLRGGKVFQIKNNQFIQGEGLTATKFMVDKKMLTKLNASNRKGKGMRMPVPQQEGDSYVINGGATYAQRLARRTRNTFKPVKKAFEDAGNKINKAVVKPAGKFLTNKKTLATMKSVGKIISKHALPELGKAAGAVVGSYMGNPAIGATLGEQIGKEVDKEVIQGLGTKRGRGRPKRVQNQVVEPSGAIMTTRRPAKYQEVYLPANGNLLHQVPIVRRVVGNGYAGHGYVTGSGYAGNGYA